MCCGGTAGIAARASDQVAEVERMLAVGIAHAELIAILPSPAGGAPVNQPVVTSATPMITSTAIHYARGSGAPPP